MANYQLGVNKAGRPYRLHPADDGREFRSELLPMPSMEELMASLETLSKVVTQMSAGHLRLILKNQGIKGG